MKLVMCYGTYSWTLSEKPPNAYLREYFRTILAQVNGREEPELPPSIALATGSQDSGSLLFLEPGIVSC